MKRIYSEEQKEKRRQRKREWYQKNKERVSLYNKQYSKVYREENRDALLEKKRNYYSNPIHIKQHNESSAKYIKTQIGRASNLANSYKQQDSLNNRGECTLTKEWIVNNTFQSKCIYCGKTDWRKLGCDRIDNSKPHTPDNVVCCCEECNKKRGTKPYEEFMKEMQLKMLEKELES